MGGNLHLQLNTKHKNTKYISLTERGNSHPPLNIRLHSKHKHKNPLRHGKDTNFTSKGSVSTTEKKNCALEGCQYLMESRLLQAGKTLDIPCKRVFERRQNLIKYSRLLYGCILCTNRVVVGGHPKTPNIVKYLFELQTKDV